MLTVIINQSISQYILKYNTYNFPNTVSRKLPQR